MRRPDRESRAYADSAPRNTHHARIRDAGEANPESIDDGPHFHRVRSFREIHRPDIGGAAIEDKEEAVTAYTHRVQHGIGQQKAVEVVELGGWPGGLSCNVERLACEREARNVARADREVDQ